jgi:hypothetical protein
MHGQQDQPEDECGGSFHWLLREQRLAIAKRGVLAGCPLPCRVCARRFQRSLFFHIPRIQRDDPIVIPLLRHRQVYRPRHWSGPVLAVPLQVSPLLTRPGRASCNPGAQSSPWLALDPTRPWSLGQRTAALSSSSPAYLHFCDPCPTRNWWRSCGDRMEIVWRILLVPDNCFWPYIFPGWHLMVYALVIRW